MSYDINCLKKSLYQAVDATIEAKELLTHIDSISGDGDLGISMERGAYAIRRELDKEIDDGISGLLARCAISLNREAPSTMGTLTSLALSEASRLMKGKQFFSDDDIIKIPSIMANVIIIRGRARLGDKTVLDSLIPFSEAIKEEYEKNGDIQAASRFACQIAEDAANATAGCLAKIGRAKWIAERCRDCPDGGAILCAIVIKSILVS